MTIRRSCSRWDAARAYELVEAGAAGMRRHPIE
jgi:hypothetical protein